MKKKKLNIFLDSGAFSAWAKGEEINLKDYIAFIKKYEKYIEVYANLDVIGDPKATLKNQKKMEKAGLSPLPCFHYGEDISYLKDYIKNYEYVSLGGMVPISSADLIKWLDKIFGEYICNTKDHKPKVRVHGFGMTSFDLMLRYPWYSVDSTSWVMTGRFGGVMVPKFRKGKYSYETSPLKVDVSTRSSSVKKEGQHITTFSELERQQILKYFTHKGYKLGVSKFKSVKEKGYTLKDNECWNGKANKNGDKEVEEVIEKGICNQYKQRDELNIIYFLDLEKNMPTYPQPFKPQRIGGLGL